MNAQHRGDDMNSIILFDEEIAELEYIILRHAISADDVIELASRAGRLADLGIRYDVYSEE